MNQLVAAIAMLGLVLLGLGVIVGRVTPSDALTRIGVFVLVLAIAPALACALGNALPALLKPALLILAAAAVVTVLVGVLRTLFS